MLDLKSRKEGNSSDRKHDRLKKQLQIDPDALDEAVMKQPVLFNEVAEQYTLCASLRDEAKSEMESVAARVSLFIRNSAGGDRKIKITNDEVDARVARNREYLIAEKEFNKLAAEAARWGTLKESFMLRGYMIREMCGLYATGYWGQSSVKGGAAGDRIVNRVRESMRPVKRRT